MEKQERHQIKENDFLTILTNVYEYYLDHQKYILYGLAGLAAVVILAYGWTHFSGGRERHAANMLAQALGGDKVDLEKLKLVAKPFLMFTSIRNTTATIRSLETF